jgi:phosphoribosylamine-glycine ligase
VDMGSDKFAVQMRVRVKADGLKGGKGVIVEDYGDHAGYSVEVGDQHIADAARRWAVLLDSGSLVFADDAHLSRE